MTEPYKALRVPIPLLHQKVYPTSHRLPKWEGVILDDKGKVVTPDKKEADASRVISPCVSTTCHTKVADGVNIFESTPYLRRFFFLVDDKERVICRYCGEVAEIGSKRSEHIACYKAISLTLKKMVKDELCAICEQPIDKIKVDQDYNDVPVCDENCMYIWERHNPDAFEFEMAITKEELEKEDTARAAKSVKNVQTFFQGSE